MQIEGFFDPGTWTVSYIVLDKATRQCALIDSVLDFDAKSGRTSTTSADRLIARVREPGGQVRWILETHVHADHLSAAPYLKEHLGGQAMRHARDATLGMPLPAESGKVTDEQGMAFGALMAESPKPVSAFCRTGWRRLERCAA